MSLQRAHADRLAAAKLWLVAPEAGDMPYLSTALYALVPVATDRVAGMSVDAHWRLYLNPLWLEATDVPAIGRELAHLVWHLLADHAGRALDVGVDRTTAHHWCTATDVTVHEVLGPAPAAAPAAPGGHLLQAPAELGLPAGRSAEEHYAALSGLPVRPVDVPPEPSNPGDDPAAGSDTGCGSGCDGQARGYELPLDDDAPGVSTTGAQGLRERVAIEYRDQMKTRGTVPGEWERWVAGVLEPVVDWRTVLRATVRRGLGWAAGHTDYTYTRMSRRQSAAGPVVLPALRRPVPRVAVVVDTSGSVDDGLLAQALGEVDGVLDGLGISGGEITVLAVDAAVHAVSTVREAAAVTLGGGGGTDMPLGIRAALKTRPRPDLVVVLTDGYTDWPPETLPVPVVAVIIGRKRGELPPTPPTLIRVECVP